MKKYCSYKEISKCRISNSINLTQILSLGQQSLTGVFPKSKKTNISKGPLDLVWCDESGLLQLKQSYNLDEMYGLNYGYRSSLNSSMVKHLARKANYLMREYSLKYGDVIVDIGANDGTFLKQFQIEGIKRIGIDPSGLKFKNFYEEGMDLLPEFFTAEKLSAFLSYKKVNLITSISMFYDLEDPLSFVKDIESVLTEDGIWHFEQSYMPSMLRMNSYDTICHEHLEFYSLFVLKSILEKCGMRILDVEMNGINGGSFALSACKKNAPHKSNLPFINWLLRQEESMGLMTPSPYRDFAERVLKHRLDLVDLIRTLRADNKKIVGYGASTKGNVLLQFCGFNSDDIECIAEVNEEKYGSFTPGTNIPIVSEREAKKLKPDYLMVLPWHFKENIIEREKEYLASGGKMIFPLPEIEIFGG